MRKLFAIAVILAVPAALLATDEPKYTNETVARLSYVEGQTFIQRASDLGFEEGILNMPIIEGDRIAASDGRTEVHIGRGNYLRMDQETKIDILNLPKKGEDLVRFRVWSGSVFVDIGRLAGEKTIEIHTADASFYILETGLYRVDVLETGKTEFLVYRGLAEAAGQEGSSLIKASQRITASEGRFTSRPALFIATADDGFDVWNEERSRDLRKEFAQRYLPEELEDFEDELLRHGRWVNIPPYGMVWVPMGVDDDWRPYHYGRWMWLPISGWTWLPYEPWGWATFHYGRWHWAVGYGWYWIPTSFWGPAWVNWWWDPYYYGWAPMSWYGYPGVLYGGRYYGRYYGDIYPYGSRALTVVRKDQLKATNISRAALRDDGLRTLTSMNLSSANLPHRPERGGISIQPIEGDRKILLRKETGTGLRDAGTAGTRPALRQPDAPARTDAPGRVTTPETKTGAGERGTAPPQERRIRRNDDSPETARTAAVSERPGAASRSIHGYPSSPAIRGRSTESDRSGSAVGSAVRRINSSSSSRSRISDDRRTSSSSSRSGTVSRGSSSSSSSRSGSGSVSRGSSSSGSSSGSGPTRSGSSGSSSGSRSGSSSAGSGSIKKK
ncbi:MAG: DUF6600 domain-containing protein [Acidobacteriota bacterium]|nr:DUF6600 domain-containing protein [Acidobacteriota bacterium]